MRDSQVLTVSQCKVPSLKSGLPERMWVRSIPTLKAYPWLAFWFALFLMSGVFSHVHAKSVLASSTCGRLPGHTHQCDEFVSRQNSRPQVYAWNRPRYAAIVPEVFGESLFEWGVNRSMGTIAAKRYISGLPWPLAVGLNVVSIFAVGFLFRFEARRRKQVEQSGASLGTRFAPVIAAKRPDTLEVIPRTAAECEMPQDLCAKSESKNGEVMSAVFAGIPYHRDGEVASAFIPGRDIDLLSRSEEAQTSHAAETRLRALLDNSADALALVNAEGRTLYCSLSAEQILNCSPYEARGCSIFEFVHQEDLDAIKRAFNESLARPRVQVKVRTRLRHENGSWLWVEAVLKNLLEVAAIQAVLINFRDITEAVTAEEEVGKSHERFVRAFQSSPLAISISTWDEGRYIDVNGAFLEMFGVTRSDVVGQTSWAMNLWVEPKSRADLLEQLNQNERHKEPVHARLRASNGEIRDVDIYGERIEMDGTQCLLAVKRDVTAAKRMENQFLRAQRMEAVGRLAGGLAHDFNNVLGVIIGYSEISQERLGGEHKLSRNIAQIKKAADRAAALIRQLLAFSRQQFLYPQILDLNEVVQNLNEMLVPMLGEDIALDFKPAASLGPIRADLAQIEQVVMNLVVNARDAMPLGGTLTIETAEVDLDSDYAANHLPVIPGKYAMMSVSDSGCGMSEQTIPHIFEPFFTTKGPGSGTGLGLSTVYGIVKQSNGYIWVYSELGKGTTFKIYFPRIPDSPEPTVESEAEKEAELDSLTGTILVVEDDEVLRSMVVRLLDLPGLKVLEAETAHAALHLVARYRGKIDLLLTDVVMPTISGGELAGRVRAIEPDVKVLFMSGYSSELVAQHGAVQRGTRVLEKPFTRRALLSQIRFALQN
jgi:PAS domain S-box-containing protein